MFHKLVHESGCRFSGLEAGIADNRFLQGDCRMYSPNQILAQCPVHTFDGDFSAPAIGDELADHTIVVGRYNVAAVGVRIHADSVATRSVVKIDAARAWRKVSGRVFRVDAALDSVIIVLHLLLFKGQWFPSGYLNLLFYEIDTGDLFRNRVLYLNTSVHLEEVEIAFRIYEELDRTGAS